MNTIEPMMDIVNVSPLAAMPAAATPGAQPARVVQQFETVFVETLLQHAGLAKALDTQEGTESGLFGELMLRELARSLAGQLHLGLGAALGMSTSDRR